MLPDVTGFYASPAEPVFLLSPVTARNIRLETSLEDAMHVTNLLMYLNLNLRSARTPRVVAFLGLIALSLSAPRASAEDGAAARAFLSKYCFTCHNERVRAAGLLLNQADVEDVSATASVWEKAVHKLRTGEMPPAGVPRPDTVTLDGFVSWLEGSLDRAATAKPIPGRVAIHRLNRVEYANAVRDLLALPVDSGSLLLADDVDEHGFDNIATVLSVSPALMEQYISAARKISRLAVGDPKVLPVFETYRLPSGLVQDERLSEDLPFGSRGGIAVQHRFPVDGEYAIRIRLKRQLYGYILGMGRPHHLQLRLNGKLVQSFTVGGDAPSAPSPASFAGNVMADPKWDLYMHNADANLEARLSVKAGTVTVSASFVNDRAESEEIPQPRETDFGLAINEFYQGNPALESVSIGGPYHVDGPGETASRNKIFICTPTGNADEACARKILSSLARSAYRRPISDAESATLITFFDKGRQQGGFGAGIQLGIERILADPNFLFRVERDPPKASPGTVYRLSDFELASRLSFFLWSSIPDAELLDVASAGKLGDPATIEHQTRRMLADDRSRALVENFATAWLDLNKARSMAPDPDQYTDFDENLRAAFLEETQLFIENQLRGDHSITDLLTANYTFMNDRLAQHYQVPNVYGSHFRKVTFPNLDQRGGLLGQGSILMATSYPNRTSPVLRGKWLLDNLLGMAPPPPPGNVPPLKESGADGKPTSVRQRMEQHRQDPACAVCHVRMDPMGFALENYDAIGKWRSTSDGLPIDAAASLPDGTQFDGVPGLRNTLFKHRDQFAATFAQKLLTYALGRELDYHDQPAIRQIIRESAQDDYRWSSIILNIVKSTPFEMSIVKSQRSSPEQMRSSR